TSFLRDSYTYMNINGHDRYDKTNHSYAWGGAAKLMEVISNNYKIQIDHYVSINYQSFVKAVDALGGVSVPVTESEASFMNRTTKLKGFESGENVLLDGKHALVYARIRKLDSEVERTRRQRELISSVIKNVKASSISDINNAIETFLPYITTNYKTTEILSLASQALTEGWLQYEIVSTVQPSEEVRYGVDYFQTYSGKLFVWIVDYIKAARELQLALYDQTNIEINASTHISAIDLARGTISSSSDDYYEDDYDEETSTEEYETHFYTEAESTTRRGIFSWLDNYGNNEETTEEETSGGYSDNGDTGYDDGSGYIDDYLEESTEEETTNLFDNPIYDSGAFGEDPFGEYYQ
ncbi:MAG: LCP family protein, partial [Clostridia bacterium]|nr:LCP family protein [Clostridia bacterium]